MLVHTPVSVGELGDKITILRIKSDRITDQEKLKNVKYELANLESIWEANGFSSTVSLDELQVVNEVLWDIEDAIRVKEAKQEFDDEFIRFARLVYKTNDKRAQFKKIINESVGSLLIEEKSYAHC